MCRDHISESKALKQEMVNSLVHKVDGLKRYLATKQTGLDNALDLEFGAR